MEKRWVFKENGNTELVRDLAASLCIDEPLAGLLVQRGVTSFEEARNFFRPDLQNLYDPFLLKDMDVAISRIEKARDAGEKILVYGDYDVDGTSAVALVYTFFRKQGFENLDFYIPNRYSEGYGISFQSIDFAADNGFALVIALDCGIKAVEKVKYARDKGIDFIICDHHRPGDELPPAVAVLDAKREDSVYPFNELSGCGVGFKLIQAYAKKTGIAFDNLYEYLDLVAVSIASDIVPITGENRILAYFGLKLINSKPRPGIEAILNVANIIRREETENGPVTETGIFTRELTINDVVFVIGPRINAAGRIESGRNSVQLLISQSLADAESIARQINDFNITRRDLDSQITQEALDMIAADKNLQGLRSTVVFNESWHKGVIGIVASRLTELYYRPTVVLTQSNGLITGSARSVKDFDIYDAIDACSDLLEHFGGHTYAAGLSLKPENLKPFKERFEQIVASSIEDRMLVPEVEIDLILDLHQITPKFLRILKQFAPFGPGNMSPVFMTPRTRDTGYARIVGKNHVKMTVFQESVRSDPFSSIAFQQGDKYNRIQKGLPMDICYHIEENEWNGNKSIQLNIKDIRFSAE
ncbi:MAG TPA: single-stranded-DNA-specific exonuclease RecJ [Bacteroidales bacterium]|nr:single-stranded-DNA-specific exonuclease RecJ [Bacteroidales bacterium]HPT02001.1 single-stranded-DNA-specific exonuclease RecJ [Bacteroidales bacterium]